MDILPIPKIADPTKPGAVHPVVKAQAAPRTALLFSDVVSDLRLTGGGRLRQGTEASEVPKGGQDAVADEDGEDHSKQTAFSEPHRIDDPASETAGRQTPRESELVDGSAHGKGLPTGSGIASPDVAQEWAIPRHEKLSVLQGTPLKEYAVATPPSTPGDLGLQQNHRVLFRPGEHAEGPDQALNSTDAQGLQEADWSPVVVRSHLTHQAFPEAERSVDSDEAPRGPRTDLSSKIEPNSHHGIRMLSWQEAQTVTPFGANESKVIAAIRTEDVPQGVQMPEGIRPVLDSFESGGTATSKPFEGLSTTSAFGRSDMSEELILRVDPVTRKQRSGPAIAAQMNEAESSWAPELNEIPMPETVTDDRTVPAMSSMDTAPLPVTAKALARMAAAVPGQSSGTPPLPEQVKTQTSPKNSPSDRSRAVGLITDPRPEVPVSAGAAEVQGGRNTQDQPPPIQQVGGQKRARSVPSLNSAPHEGGAYSARTAPIKPSDYTRSDRHSPATARNPIPGDTPSNLLTPSPVYEIARGHPSAVAPDVRGHHTQPVSWSGAEGTIAQSQAGQAVGEAIDQPLFASDGSASDRKTTRREPVLLSMNTAAEVNPGILDPQITRDVPLGRANRATDFIGLASVPDPASASIGRRPPETQTAEPQRPPPDEQGARPALQTAMLRQQTEIVSGKIVPHDLDPSAVRSFESRAATPPLRDSSGSNTAMPTQSMPVVSYSMIQTPGPQMAVHPSEPRETVDALTTPDDGVGSPVTHRDAVPGQPMTAAAGPQAPLRSVLAQIAQAMPQPGQQAVEITLNPEELGRVRMSLSSQDGTLTMTLTADRAETLDLMRRHAAELGQEYRALGYTSIDFQFQQNGSSERRSEQSTGSDRDVGPMIENVPLAQHAPRSQAATGLDIRI